MTTTTPPSARAAISSHRATARPLGAHPPRQDREAREARRASAAASASTSEGRPGRGSHVTQAVGASSPETACASSVVLP